MVSARSISRRSRLVVLCGAAAAVALLIAGLLLPETGTAQTAAGAVAGYVRSSTCAGCHRAIWDSYQKTGMGRAFYRPTAATVGAGEYVHKASDSYFRVYEREPGRFYQRRHQLDGDGREVNVFEKPIDFILGSGNHARTFLSRTPQNKLIELPLGWYADKGGYFAMNPGYDRMDHDGFQRTIGYECMYCHNGYPRIPAGHEKPLAEPVYVDPLPEGIDCQRCHGPGSQHVALAGMRGAKAEQVRAAIVNPERLSRERREEVCIQCHLETTSFPLPNSLPRYDRGPFDYKPGEELSRSWLFFDHAPEAGRGDKFEIVNAVYRMRQSQCYLASKGALECGSCHNPHDVPRGEAAQRHYDAACSKCHSAASIAPRHDSGAEVSGCADCHMPKRRTEDVVHSLATDHLIQRNKPSGDLTAARAERHEEGATAYHGEVILYYPKNLPATAANELYLALAQVIDKSNLDGGIPRLQRAVAASGGSARMEFYLALAEAWTYRGQLQRALPVYREAVRRDPRSVFALRKLGIALRQSGQLGESVVLLVKATSMAPNDPLGWHELGLAFQAQGRPADAAAAFAKAIALDADLPEPHSNLGVVRLAAGDHAGAAAAFREAIRIRPDYADAHDNLGTLLAGAGSIQGARQHFEIALRLRPNDARTRYNFAMALGRAREFDEAQKQLEAAVRADPRMLDARLVLGDMLMAREQSQAALEQYRAAVGIDPQSPKAQLGLGMALAMTGDAAEAVEYLKKAAAGPDAGVREAASGVLRQMGQ